MITFDTETCGFHGPIVLIQYSYDGGEIHLWEPWCEKIIDTLLLLEEIATHEEGIVGFNLSFDWFHMQRMYNLLTLLGEKVGMDEQPRDHIDVAGTIDIDARDGACLKPVTALDLMLHARKGPYQSTMDRKEIRVRRVPKALAYPLSKQLEQRIPLKDIYFARSKDQGAKWKIFPVTNYETGKTDEDFVDIVLKFNSSTALKALAVDAGVREADSRLLFHDVNTCTRPLEIGWAPFATALSTKERGWKCKIGKKEGSAWPGVIEEHINHWRFDDLARQYAIDDVEDTYNMFIFFERPEMGDDDSILACMVGSVRWRGYSIDEDQIRALKKEETSKSRGIPADPSRVFKYISKVMSETEIKSLRDKQGKTSTKKVILEGISKWTLTCTCVHIEHKIIEGEEAVNYGFGDECQRTEAVKIPKKDCTICKGKGEILHPAAICAEAVLEKRKGATKIILYNKLLQAGRLHPAASVIGSLSGRMSGRTEVTDGKRSSNINALGIQHEKIIRQAFPLAHGDLILCGGDFDAFEVSIADAAYDDIELRRQLLTCHVCKIARELKDFDETACPHCNSREGWCKGCEKIVVATCNVCPCGQPLLSMEATLRKIHGLFAMELYPGNTYDQILATKGMDPDLYDDGKRGIFSQFYGGDENTLVERIGVDLEAAEEANRRFNTRYLGVGRAKQRAYDKHCSMRQVGGIGSRIDWHEPAEYVESLTGFKRYFTLENKITHALFILAENPPKEWLQLKIKVMRRDRQQKVGNAVRSAVFAAAFQIQAQCMRAALNHEIQSTGAVLTKILQRLIWELQPSGSCKWHVQPMNIHDEIMCPALKERQKEIEDIVLAFIIEYRSLIPLLKMSWKNGMKNWAEK